VIRALSRKVAPRQTPPGLLFPLAELVNFGVLVAAGFWYRRRSDIHKRLMLLAAIVLTGEPILHLVGHLSRWPALRGAGVGISVPLTFLLLFSSAIHDRISRGRIHPVSLWVPILLFAWQILPASVVLPCFLRQPDPSAPQKELLVIEHLGHLAGTGPLSGPIQFRRERRSFLSAKAYLRPASTINS